MCDLAEVFHLPSATLCIQHEESDAASRLLIDFLDPGAVAR